MPVLLLTSLALASTDCLPASGQVVETSPNHFEIQKSLVSAWTTDLEKAESLAYTAWHRGDDGKRDGFRVRKIQCGNPLDEAGFENGDVVHSINGQEVTGMTDVFWVWRKVRKADTVTVALSRKDGTQQTLSYALQ